MPLALPLLDGLARYVRYHVVDEVVGRPGFDVLTAFVYRDAQAATRVLGVVAGDGGAVIREDELAFMDKPANTFCQVSETRLVDGEEGEEALFVLVGRRVDEARVDASRRRLRDHWPDLLRRCVDPGFVLARDAFPVAGVDVRFEGVLQVCATETGGVVGWAKQMLGAGHDVVAVRTRRFETTLADTSTDDARVASETAR